MAINKRKRRKHKLNVSWEEFFVAVELLCGESPAHAELDGYDTLAWRRKFTELLVSCNGDPADDLRWEARYNRWRIARRHGISKNEMRRQGIL